ncbi:hypothetical protein DID88_000461 [Monilinia fructigena]|uniref:Uncharacterized protein n=1 Tax=Monilinia fructigena TaxID=38457 RepID=A0A395IHM7_9HELO|nr:hypothetical protein DID88_000461 [Monilinia fructigena]
MLTNTHFHLLDNPNLLQTLRDELKEAMPDRYARANLKDLEALPFLNAVANEGLRLSYGISTRLPRISPYETMAYKNLGDPRRHPRLNDFNPHPPRPQHLPLPPNLQPLPLAPFPLPLFPFPSPNPNPRPLPRKIHGRLRQRIPLLRRHQPRTRRDPPHARDHLSTL